MMFFHNLDIKALRRKHLRRLLNEMKQRIDTERHVGSFEYCYFLCCPFDLFQLILIIAGGAKHCRKSCLFTIGEKIIQNLSRRKINQSICLHITVKNGRKYRIVISPIIRNIDPRHNLGFFILRHKVRDHFSHGTIAAAHYYPCHVVHPFQSILRKLFPCNDEKHALGVSPFAGNAKLECKHSSLACAFRVNYMIPAFFISSASLAAFFSSISVKGARRDPTSIPIRFIAFFTGMGFTSQNRAPIRS